MSTKINYVYKIIIDFNITDIEEYTTINTNSYKNLLFNIQIERAKRIMFRGVKYVHIR